MKLEDREAGIDLDNEGTAEISDALRPSLAGQPDQTERRT
jgi:hypothetical protein